MVQVVQPCLAKDIQRYFSCKYSLELRVSGSHANLELCILGFPGSRFDLWLWNLGQRSCAWRGWTEWTSANCLQFMSTCGHCNEPLAICWYLSNFCLARRWQVWLVNGARLSQGGFVNDPPVQIKMNIASINSHQMSPNHQRNLRNMPLERTKQLWNHMAPLHYVARTWEGENETQHPIYPYFPQKTFHPYTFHPQTFHPESFTHILLTRILFTRRLFNQTLFPRRLFTRRLLTLHQYIYNSDFSPLFTHRLFTHRLFTHRLSPILFLTHILFTQGCSTICFSPTNFHPYFFHPQTYHPRTFHPQTF